MKLFERADATDIASFKEEMRLALKESPSLESAAQVLATSIYTAFQSSTVLARVYAALPFARLPPSERAFVEALVANTDPNARVKETTFCLCLLGSYGADRAWNDRQASKGHLAIPLLSRAFVEAAPMLARLLNDLGIDLGWLDNPSSDFSRALVGGFNGVFYVPDAATTKDARGRHIIPAQDFVTRHRVKTVFGMGGFYMQGTMVAIILFTRENVSRMQAERFSALSGILKVATNPLVAQGKFFTAPLPDTPG